MNSIIKFYKSLPFNKVSDKLYCKQVNKSKTPWIQLDSCIEDSNDVLELGCGTGWLSNRIANNYNVNVTGIDILKENIDNASKYKNKNTEFFEEDILTTTRRADTVVSIGVLHHMPNQNIKNLIRHSVNLANKYAFIGLYYKHSRDAVLEYFDNIPKDKRYKHFKKLTPWITDDVQSKSWFRDQFEHPYECSVTLEDFNIGIEHQCFGHYDKNRTLERINNGEFVSGFIYGVFNLND